MPNRQHKEEEEENTEEFKKRTGFDKTDRDVVKAVMRSTFLWRIFVGLGLGWTAVGHQFAGGESFVKEADFQRLERKVDKMSDRVDKQDAVLNEISKEIFQIELELRHYSNNK